MVENKLADRLCFEHWVKSEDETIRVLSAPLVEPRNWRISSRLEEYKKALQTAARMERLFAKGSEIKRKMRARAGLSD